MPIPRSDQPPATAFDAAAMRLIASIETHGREAVARGDDYRVVVTALARYAQGFGLSDGDAEEVAAETVAEAFMRTAEHGRGEVRKPGAYLFWTTRNRVLDRRRRADTREATEMLVDDLEQSVGARYYSRQDDELAQLLDQDATAELLEDALRAAVAAQDHLVVRVVTVWLELAEETGEAPTSRKVAREVGASHTSINQALRRMRAYFPAGISRTSSE